MVCLRAFEKFSGGKTCPMCRKEQYETRLIHEGRKLWRHKCAIKIQSRWRGYVIRSWYVKLRKTVPPNDPLLRKKFFEEKLSLVTDRFVMVTSSEVDSFLHQIDQSIEESRRVMRLVDDQSFKVLSDMDWEKVYAKANERLHSDCPICFTAFHSSDIVGQLESSKKSETTVEFSRPIILLSCSHVFHKQCLEAFELLSLASLHVCPVCRSPYYKKELHCDVL
ncbi:RING finger protein 32-like [Xenia sp. Carnegie-2017]|uniref:RING finger protein 32-like n=1 Tax=Xenia sp. Carnegie-2017 TaxID=2897299 RepID=UPI001F03AB19|nr:RING finger protein 32-like [Xenia sp. Carnegie-2017]